MSPDSKDIDLLKQKLDVLTQMYLLQKNLGVDTKTQNRGLEAQSNPASVPSTSRKDQEDDVCQKLKCRGKKKAKKEESESEESESEESESEESESEESETEASTQNESDTDTD